MCVFRGGASTREAFPKTSTGTRGYLVFRRPSQDLGYKGRPFSKRRDSDVPNTTFSSVPGREVRSSSVLSSTSGPHLFTPRRPPPRSAPVVGSPCTTWDLCPSLYPCRGTPHVPSRWSRPDPTCLDEGSFPIEVPTGIRPRTLTQDSGTLQDRVISQRHPGSGTWCGTVGLVKYGVDQIPEQVSSGKGNV